MACSATFSPIRLRDDIEDTSALGLLSSTWMTVRQRRERYLKLVLGVMSTRGRASLPVAVSYPPKAPGHT